MIRKGMITSVTFNRKTRERTMKVVKPEEYIEPSRPLHTNTSYDPDNRKGHKRGGYLKYTYGK